MKCLCSMYPKASAAALFLMLTPLPIQSAQAQKVSDENLSQIEPAANKEKQPVSNYVLDYEMKTIEGKMLKLDSFKGKVIMMVNTASKCGNTPQYEGLEAMYRAHKKDGLVIIGFPANNFMGQEPGTDEQIAEFCSTKYDVTFPMMAKISVKGKDAAPLYQQLAAQPEPVGGEPTWNFDKFIINRKGEVVARFGPRTKPDDKELVKTIETLLSSD